MSQQNRRDDLDEMLLPKGIQKEIEDDIKLREPRKKEPKKTAPAKKRPKVSKKDQKTMFIAIGVGVAVFIVLLVMLVVMGNMGANPSDGRSDRPYTEQVTMAEPDPDKTSFYNAGNVPELSNEGVKGLLKQAYYTVDGDLAVVLNLSNGTASEQQVVRVNATVFNDSHETVAQQTIDRFDPACYVGALSHGEVYFVIDRQNVVLRNDPLSKLGVTLEIASIPTDGSQPDGPKGNGPVVGDGPKDIAEGRSYYENLGNLPEMSEEGVKASVIRARYTNDGSLAVTLSLSNGTPDKQQVSKVEFHLMNGNGDVIADYTFDSFETPCQIDSKGFSEMELMVDAGYVQRQDDPLSTLSYTISVSAGPLA